MKKVHTQKKSANRSFDTSATGYPNELYRKYSRKSIPKGRVKFPKPKPRRTKIQRTDYPVY